MDELIERARPWAIGVVLHNWPLFIYGPLGFIVAVRLLIRPGRAGLLALYGLAALTIAFEYAKHGPPVIMDTTNYLFSLETNGQARITSRWILLQIVPITLHAVGFTLVLAAVVMVAVGGLYKSRVRSAIRRAEQRQVGAFSRAASEPERLAAD